jgi:hypothetical protein
VSKAIVAVVSVLALVSAGSAWGGLSKLPALIVKPGYRHTFTKAALHPGATVRCVDQGRTLSVQAPTAAGEANGAGWPRPGTRDRSIFTLNVDAATSQAFVVTCVRGGIHSALVTAP